MKRALVFVTAILFIPSLAYAWPWNSEVVVDGSADAEILKASALFEELPSDPGTPTSNRIKLYAKDDGGTTKLYTKDSAGTVTEVGAGGGLDINGLTEESAVTSGDFFPFYDATATANRKIDFDDLVTAIGGVSA